MFLSGTGNWKLVFEAIASSPTRHWSCSSVEEVTGLSHATVFRALQKCKELGIVKTSRINKRDIIYDFVSSPLTTEVEHLLTLHSRIARSVAKKFVAGLKRKKYSDIQSVLLYGSTVKKKRNYDSDIDLLIIIKKRNSREEKKIQDLAAEYSYKANITLSVVILSQKEFKKERNMLFLQDIQKKYEVLYGTNPF
ncbi:nucleotidyltransferase domain-containing protein [Candidatus Woesearchaeota archaeon]|nr:nucleotidyltransferase domain-containing protein [Candidatus Woesearchaeota archaeon]